MIYWQILNMTDQMVNKCIVFGFTIINKTNSRQNGLANILSPIPPSARQQPHLVNPPPFSLSSNVGNSMSFFGGDNFPAPYTKREYANRYN